MTHHTETIRCVTADDSATPGREQATLAKRSLNSPKTKLRLEAPAAIGVREAKWQMADDQMETAFEKLSAQGKQLIPAAESLAKQAAAYASAHSSAGLPLYDAKVHVLLRYTASLCRYAAARARGDPEGDIAGLQQGLVEGWAMLDRARPIEKAARPTLEGLLKRAARARAASAANVPVRNVAGKNDAVPNIAPRPDPGNLVMDDDDGAENDSGSEHGQGEKGEDAKMYRPPRIAEVVYDGERDVMEEREARARAKMQARAARSRSVREMLAEVSGRPDEVRDNDEDEEGAAGREMARLRREEEERTRYEEDNFTRLNITREDRKRRQRLATAAERSGIVGDVGGDAFADLMGVAERVIGKGSASKRAGEDRVNALDAFDRGLAPAGTEGRSGSGARKKRNGGSGPSKKKKSRQRR